MTFDAKVKSADVDIHSSYGGVVESAPWYLLQALQSLRAADGRILVEGLYEEVQSQMNVNWPWWILTPNEIQGKSARFMVWNCLSYKRIAQPF